MIISLCPSMKSMYCALKRFLSYVCGGCVALSLSDRLCCKHHYHLGYSRNLLPSVFLSLLTLYPATSGVSLVYSLIISTPLI